MSLADAFLTTARDLLMMSENIKRMDGRIDKLVDETRALDRRIMRIEVMIDIAKQPPHKPTPEPHPHPRRRASKQLPPQTGPGSES